VPRKSEIYVRYYGAYSVRRRAAWRERGIRPGRRLPEEPIEPVPEAVRARRRADGPSCCAESGTSTSPPAPPAAGRWPSSASRWTPPPSIRRSDSEKGHDPPAGPWAQRAPPATPP
jgi:hypothetical protein